MSKHKIRLKEHERNRQRPAHPSKQAYARSDKSIDLTEYPLDTDEHGFIKTGVEVDDSLPSVFCVGGSFVESSFAMPDRRFVGQVAHKLRSHNVLNTAYSGTTLLEATAMILTKIPALAKRGDTIVVFSMQSDANASRLKGGYWTNNPTYTAIRPRVESEPTWDASFADTTALLRSLAAFAHGMGFKLIVATSPYRYLDWEKDTWCRLNFGNVRTMRDFRARRDALTDTYREFARVTGTPIIDLAAEVDGRSEYFYDELHFNNRGHDVGANYVYRRLKEIL